MRGGIVEASYSEEDLYHEHAMAPEMKPTTVKAELGTTISLSQPVQADAPICAGMRGNDHSKRCVLRLHAMREFKVAVGEKM